MKVGIYIDAYDPAVGGAYNFVVELLAALDRVRTNCGHELVLCYRQSAAAIADRFPDFPSIDLDAHKLEVLSPIERVIDVLPAQFERIRNRIRPPAIHWFDRVNAKEGIQFVIRLAPWNAGGVDTPFAFVSFDLQHRVSPWFPEVSASREWERRDSNQSLMFRRAHTVFTGTQQGRDEIERYFQISPERIKVLPFPVPEFALKGAAEPRSPETLSRLQVPAEYLFFPAQFWAHKNHVTLLEACKIVREKANWNIGVVFSGSDKGNLGYLKEYARKLGIEKSVRFLGFINQADLVQLYKGAFCLAYPTFFGPDNLPPLEAFALGCPVVASAVPGASEQLGDAALLFPPDDESALADAILKLRDPDLRARIIEAGASRARQWSWDDYAHGVIESVDQFSRIRRTWA